MDNDKKRQGLLSHMQAAVPTTHRADRLNIGCGRRHMDGFTNVDKNGSVNPDVVLDVDKTPWPFTTGSVSHVLMSHVLEHVKDVTVCLDEAWRVLRHNGTLQVTVPHYKHINSYTDPTHRRFFTEHSMRLYTNDPRYERLSDRLWVMLNGPDIVYTPRRFPGWWHVRRYLRMTPFPQPTEIRWLLTPDKETTK